MRGDGDLPLPGANIKIIEGILADQRQSAPDFHSQPLPLTVLNTSSYSPVLANVTGKTITDIPQSWCLYKGSWLLSDPELRHSQPLCSTFFFRDNRGPGLLRRRPPGPRRRHVSCHLLRIESALSRPLSFDLLYLHTAFSGLMIIGAMFAGSLLRLRPAALVVRACTSM